jgi:DNA repair protein RadD
MLQLRPYQEQAVQSLFDYWAEEPGNPLIVMATGAGKTPSFCTVIKKLVEEWDMRIMCVTHVAELIEQGYKELIGMWPFAPAGIFSAGLGRRDSHSQIIFGGIQTVANKAAQIGHIDVLMIDEAHLVPPKAETQYGQFIAALLAINPDMKIVGWTATDFRLDSGKLTEGENALFSKVVFEYNVGDAIAEGYLAPLSSKPTATTFDMSGVHRLGGDYKQSEMQAAVDKDEITRAAVAEIVAKGQDRRSWLAFCSGVDHALHVRDEIRSYGISCETITGETPKDERRRILEAYKRYEIRCLTNNSVLTTGFNHKGVDLLAFLRPTLSASLYLQMAGRATRPLYAPGMPLDTVEDRLAAIAVGPKPSALVLDFAGLVRKHGPVDRVEPKAPGKGSGEAPVKQCPNPVGSGTCDELVHISVMVCPCCGFEFPPSEETKLTAKADITPVLSTEKPWTEVTGRSYAYHQPRDENKRPSVKATYTVGKRKVDEWIFPGHGGTPKAKSDRYWLLHGGKRPFPASVDEFLDRAGELLATTEVQLDYSKSTKYPDVKAYRTGEATYETELPKEPKGNIAVALAGKRGNLAGLGAPSAESKAAAERARLAALAEEWDEIPF